VASRDQEQLKKCECDFRTRLVGDGCRYCQPQEYIDTLEMQITDLQIENEILEDRISILEEK